MASVGILRHVVGSDFAEVSEHADSAGISVATVPS